MMDEAPGDMGREGIHVFVLVMNASGFGRREREIHDLQVTIGTNKGLHRIMPKEGRL